MNHNLEYEIVRAGHFSENSIGFAFRSPSIFQASFAYCGSQERPKAFRSQCLHLCIMIGYDKSLKSESESHSVVSGSLRPCGLYSSWNSPGQNAGVGSFPLLQRIFPTQELNPGLLHCRQILRPPSYEGNCRTVWRLLKKLKIELPYDPTI